MQMNEVAAGGRPAVSGVGFGEAWLFWAPVLSTMELY